MSDRISSECQETHKIHSLHGKGLMHNDAVPIFGITLLTGLLSLFHIPFSQKYSDVPGASEREREGEGEERQREFCH